MSAPLIDRQQIAARHGLSYRYVRDTLTKRPDLAVADRIGGRQWRLSRAANQYDRRTSHSSAKKIPPPARAGGGRVTTCGVVDNSIGLLHSIGE